MMKMTAFFYSNIFNNLPITLFLIFEGCLFKPHLINNANVATSANAIENEVDGRESEREQRSRKGGM